MQKQTLLIITCKKSWGGNLEKFCKSHIYTAKHSKLKLIISVYDKSISVLSILSNQKT